MGVLVWGRGLWLDRLPACIGVVSPWHVAWGLDPGWWDAMRPWKPSPMVLACGSMDAELVGPADAFRRAARVSCTGRRAVWRPGRLSLWGSQPEHSTWGLPNAVSNAWVFHRSIGVLGEPGRAFAEWALGAQTGLRTRLHVESCAVRGPASRRVGLGLGTTKWAGATTDFGGLVCRMNVPRPKGITQFGLKAWTQRTRHHVGWMTRWRRHHTWGVSAFAEGEDARLGMDWSAQKDNVDWQLDLFGRPRGGSCAPRSPAAPRNVGRGEHLGGNGACSRWMVKAIGVGHTSWFVHWMAGCGRGPRARAGAWGFG